MWRMIFDDLRKITESARIGSTESSEGLSVVRVMGSPKSQLAKSVGKVSAKNLQILSIIITMLINKRFICFVKVTVM